MKITCKENKNGIYYPNLSLSAGTTYSIGKYGRVYLDYLKKYWRGTYTTLLTENRLNEPLHRVDIEAREMVLKITEEIVIARGIGEYFACFGINLNDNLVLFQSVVDSIRSPSAFSIEGTDHNIRFVDHISIAGKKNTLGYIVPK